MKYLLQIFNIFFMLYVASVYSINSSVNGSDNNLIDECKDENSLLCGSARVINNIVKSYKDNNKSRLIIVPGLEIVPLEKSVNEFNENNVFNGRSNMITDDSLTSSSTSKFYNRFSNYLRNHEIKIKFSEIFDKNDFKETLMKTLTSFDEGKGVQEGRKKDKGMGAVMIMGLMMAKMMAALGLGGIGALAMKALGVSMMALLLAGIVGLKSLAHSGHDDGGHHVQYITADHGHHRKRRSLNNNNNNDNIKERPLPYRGWSYHKN